MPEVGKRAWFVNEDAGVYEYDTATQAADFPNDSHTAYATQADAERAADAMAGLVPPTAIEEAERLIDYWERHGDNPEAVAKWAVSDLLEFARLVIKGDAE